MDLPEVADVLIIGAGASGGIAAKRLVEAGLKVVALEQGDWQDPARYRGAHWDWELTALKPWSSNPNIRRAPADYPIDVADSDMQIVMFNGVGGSTILFNGNWHRLQPDDFRRRSVSGLADDWPISYAEMEPFYDRTDREIGVSGLAGDPMYPPSAELPLPPFNLRPGPLSVARVLHRRGWHWWPTTNAILSAPYQGRRGCIQRGTCQTGCNEGAKSSIDITHWKPATQAGCRVVTGARVRRIVLDTAGLAAGAEWLDRNGTLHLQRARAVLCAANGVGTPRLLLASACERFPDGLANRSDLVGRRLMLHPIAKVLGYFPESLASWEGPNGSDLHCMQFADIDPGRGFINPSKWSLHPAGDGPVAEALRVLAKQSSGREHHDRFRARFGHSLKWIVMCEDMPEESNRVSLAPHVTDSSGLPGAKISYRFTESVRRALTFNSTEAAGVFREAGAVEVDTLDPASTGAHLMGTARMGDDPRRSVVDRWCMSHDIPNLGILDGSVFVTASCVNPTSTICALALRTAERLIERWAELPQPAALQWSPEPAPVPPAFANSVPVFPTASQRERLAQLADALIPGDDDLPSASDAGGAAAGLDRVLETRPDLAQVLPMLLSDPSAHPISWLHALQAKSPAAHRQLLEIVAGAYYTEARVREAIGYPGQPERPHRPDRMPAYIAEGLLDHMMPAG
jgi:choline dehydrogenase-like flavoprotein